MKIRNLKATLPLLKDFRKILVTGPQRSGTTIASKIISHELGLKWITEESIDIDSLDLFFKVHASEGNYVLQAPGLSFVCHRLPVDAVIFMWRADGEINESAVRIGWMGHDKYESDKYFNEDVNQHSWSIKKDAFEKFQMKRIKNAFTLSYESLEGHQLYVNADLRKRFHSRQIEVK